MRKIQGTFKLNSWALLSHSTMDASFIFELFQVRVVMLTWMVLYDLQPLRFVTLLISFQPDSSRRINLSKCLVGFSS